MVVACAVKSSIFVQTLVDSGLWRTGNCQWSRGWWPAIGNRDIIFIVRFVFRLQLIGEGSRVNDAFRDRGDTGTKDMSTLFQRRVAEGLFEFTDMQVGEMPSSCPTLTPPSKTIASPNQRLCRLSTSTGKCTSLVPATVAGHLLDGKGRVSGLLLAVTTVSPTRKYAHLTPTDHLRQSLISTAHLFLRTCFAIASHPLQTCLTLCNCTDGRFSYMRARSSDICKGPRAILCKETSC